MFTQETADAQAKPEGRPGISIKHKEKDMKILVLNGSPTGENSITLQTVNYIGEFFPDCTFDVLHVGARIRLYENDFSEAKAALEAADLILFCYPVYTFLVPAQLHRFIELMKESGAEIAGKFAAQITTSLHFYDVTAHRFIEGNCADMGLRSLGVLSADMEDLLHEKGQKEALDFWRFVMWSADQEAAAGHAGSPAADPEPDAWVGKLVIVTDLAPEPDESLRAADEAAYEKALLDHAADMPLRGMIRAFRAEAPFKTKVVNLREFPFKGGCLGCFHCASDGTCIYQDGFDEFLRKKIQRTDAIVYAYRVKDHSMGYRMKLFDDRQFCNGHRTVTMGRPVGYLVDGDLSAEPNLQMLMEARAQVGGNFLAGIASTGGAEALPAGQIERLARTLAYAVKYEYQPPKNFYGVGGLKIFRDLIWQMQGLMKEDHRFYKAHGFYDFPQKRAGRMLAMYLVGGMMGSKTLQKKIGGKMTEGMLLPYRKVLEKARRKG